MSKYKITLTPTGKFFFGGDQRFQIGDTKDESFDSYIIESRKFPQQTSLLGMLRFLILSNSDAFNISEQKIKDKDAASKLIGPASFSNSGEKNDFGVIQTIGPCGLCKNNGDIVFPVQKCIIGDGLSDFDKECTHYSAKEGIAVTFGGINESEIFRKDKRMGINRDIETGRTEDADLYKQVFYRLADGYSFAFETEIDDSKVECSIDLNKYDKQLVSVGGDNSQFIIGITSINDFQFEETNEKGSIVTLLSDAYIPNNVKDNCFAVSGIVPFKCMKTSVQTEHYNRINSKIGYSDKLYLYKAGSIFFFENEIQFKKFKREIDKHEDFRQIGYNHYQVK